jgi:hypothetical protein
MYNEEKKGEFVKCTLKVINLILYSGTSVDGNTNVSREMDSEKVISRLQFSQN